MACGTLSGVGLGTFTDFPFTTLQRNRTDLLNADSGRQFRIVVPSTGRISGSKIGDQQNDYYQWSTKGKNRSFEGLSRHLGWLRKLKKNQ